MWDEAQSSQNSSPRSSKSDKKVFIFAGVGVLVLVLIVAAVYFFVQYQNAQKLLSNPNSVSQRDTDNLISKVSALIDLPKDEKPTIATVSDKFKLNSQAFFAKVENGDQVLIYEKNKEAVLYRPSTNKIINFSTGITVGQNTPASTSQQVAGATAAPTEPVTPSPAPSISKVSPTFTKPIPTTIKTIKPTVTSAPSISPSP